MLKRTHVAPFLHVIEGEVTVDFLRDPEDGRVVAFLERVLRLTRRVEGCERRAVVELLRRQERRVRDASRLAGISKTLLDLCEFRVPPGAVRAAEARDALFTARGALWPPLPGDERLPYETAALMLHLSGADAIARTLYADAPAARVLHRAPRLDGRALLDRYNVDLARAVLLDATSLRLTARGGWRAIFRAVKLARLMYTLERAGRTRRSYVLTLTGPASRYLAKPQRYGARFARVVPALTRAPGWKLAADVVHGDAHLHYTLEAERLPVPRRRGRPRFDSHFESALAAEFHRKLGAERHGWTLSREDAPVVRGESVFLPDFTMRHHDGREALVEIVGFWTPEYMADKLSKIRGGGLDNLVLVVYRALNAGGALETALAESGAVAQNVVWFEAQPRIGAVMEAVERAAR
jgi:uncharacterized protein